MSSSKQKRRRTVFTAEDEPIDLSNWLSIGDERQFNELLHKLLPPKSSSSSGPAHTATANSQSTSTDTSYMHGFRDGFKSEQNSQMSDPYLGARLPNRTRETEQGGAFKPYVKDDRFSHREVPYHRDVFRSTERHDDYQSRYEDLPWPPPGDGYFDRTNSLGAQIVFKSRAEENQDYAQELKRKSATIKRTNPPRDPIPPPPKSRAEENQDYAQELKRMSATIIEVVHERQGKNAMELTVEKGDVLQVLDNSRNWWKVKNARGETGYAPYTVLAEDQPRDELVEAVNQAESLIDDTENKWNEFKDEVDQILEFLEDDDCSFGIIEDMSGDSASSCSSWTDDEEPSEDKDRFIAQLIKFCDDRGTPMNKGPSIGNKDLNLYELFRIVQKLGGYNRVTNQMKWRLVYSEMGLPPSNMAYTQMKNAYKKYLHAFEDFYRKLGSSMGTISRPGQQRNDSGRRSFRGIDTGRTPEKKSDLLDGLSTLDPKWTELYLQALLEGKEKQRNVRLMIVGHEGVGKTTLVRNLMNKSLQGVETTNGIEVHVRTGLVEVDGTWKESETGSKDAKVGERIARIIEPVNKKDKQAQTDNIPSNASSANAITETSTLEIVKAASQVFPLDTKKALYTDTSQQLSISHEDKEKDISITGQTIENVKQLMMVSQTQQNTNLDTCNTVSVWDFGGQFIFYATHQIFHSSGAIYLLVLDLSKGFEDMIDDGCPVACHGTKGRTVQDFIKFWMHSIHTFTCSKTGEPPVILIGTHRDKIDEQEMSKEEYAENYFENVRKLFDKTQLLHHIQPQHFFLDNLGPDKNCFNELRSKIMATAMQQSSYNKEIPAKWIPLEQALCQIENKPYITFSEVCEIDSKSDVPIADVEVIRLLLMHLHFQGRLVYFNEEELQDYVILNPQWIIDAFKCIITSWRVFSKEPNLREIWQDFENTAVLKNSLIEEVWKRNEKTDFLADKELLLKFLVRLGIMSRGRAYDEGTRKVEELDFFLVPSLLPVQKDESGMENLLVNAVSTQMVIVFKFEDAYISPTIYHRTTAAAVGKWEVVEIRGTQQLYGNLGIYRLDRHNVGVVRLTDKTIELSVHNLCGKPVSCGISDSFRRFIAKAIKQELSRFHCGKETEITTTFRCSCSKQGSEKEHVATEELKGVDRLPCPVTLSHIIHGRVAYIEWFVDADTFVQRNRQDLQTKLGDREIGGISKAIGLNWQLLGMDLGLPKVELEQIQMDHPYSSAVQIRYMLQTWKERAVGEATMQALYDKMKDNPEVSIDWDKIKDVIDSCSSQR